METKFYTGWGKVNYSNGWVVLNVRYDIVRYYKYVVFKTFYKKINTPQHGAHITIVAGKYNDVQNHKNWGRHQDERIRFQYEPKIHSNDKYFWLRIRCKKFLYIRRGLGLDRPHQPWHLTIGNLKNL